MRPSNLSPPFLPVFSAAQQFILGGSQPTLAFVLALIRVNALSWEPFSLWKALHTNSGLCWHLMAALRTWLCLGRIPSFPCMQHLQDSQTGPATVALWKAIGLHDLHDSSLNDSVLIFVWLEEQRTLPCSLQPCSCVLKPRDSHLGTAESQSATPLSCWPPGAKMSGVGKCAVKQSFENKINSKHS